MAPFLFVSSLIMRASKNFSSTDRFIFWSRAANSTLLKAPLLSLSKFLKTSLKTNSSVCFSVPVFSKLNLIAATKASRSFGETLM